jgi:hypothetical protein
VLLGLSNAQVATYVFYQRDFAVETSAQPARSLKITPWLSSGRRVVAFVLAAGDSMLRVWSPVVFVRPPEENIGPGVGLHVQIVFAANDLRAIGVRLGNCLALEIGAAENCGIDSR